MDALAHLDVSGIATRDGEPWFSTAITIVSSTPSHAIFAALTSIGAVPPDEWRPSRAEAAAAEQRWNW